jgi:ESS family glutamate:Na+ symporter
MNAFTPWTLFVDLGIVAALLLVGKFIRVKVKAVQKMFIPPSLIAGFLGLLLGPEGLGWLPFSGQLGTYAGILIALVFACLPFTSAKVTKEQRGGIGKMWAYSQGGCSSNGLSVAFWGYWCSVRYGHWTKHSAYRCRAGSAEVTGQPLP